MIKEIYPGDPMYVILRDDCAEPVEVTGYIFLMTVKDVVFGAPGINGSRDLDVVLAYLMNRTEDDDELPLVAVPQEDCYSTREEAEEARQREYEY